MRAAAAAAAVVLAASVVLAHAQPSKPLPTKVAAEAKKLFADAEAAEARGDLDAAAAAYKQAFAIAPHADVQFNLAGVLMRDQNPRGAVTAFEKYLALAPDAGDRGDVEDTIRLLEATPGTLEIGSRPEGLALFVDGKRVGVTPQIVQAPDGEHRLETFTAISYKSMMHRADWARTHRFNVTPPPRVDGNVVLSGHPSLGRTKVKVDGADAGRLGSKLEMASGKRTVEVIYKKCTWTHKLVAPSVASEIILYVYLDLSAPVTGDTCPRGKFRSAPLDL
jgi:tetratricopeptide (TPR) repeat protein